MRQQRDNTVSAATRRARQVPRELRIAVFAYDGVELLDVVGPLEAFATAAALAGRAPPPYRIEIVAERKGRIRASSGLALEATAALATIRGVDTLLVAGGAGIEAACARPGVIASLARQAKRVRRIGSVCNGAFLLAEAGLLDGRRAATHWNWCERLAARYPAVRVEQDPIFICDDGIWSSAGVTAGIDLALAMIEQDHGPELALRAARELVMFRKRPGGQSQFSTELAAQSTRDDRIRRVQESILRDPAADLRVDALAALANMSPRHFARVFRQDTGLSPADFAERARIDKARSCLETTAESIEGIASACGFHSADVMRRAFLRRLDVTPTEYRERFGNAGRA
jgi:transcriptional regulator GlxA family with amidase domain